MFNVMRYTKELEEAGFTKDQAEKTLTVMMEVMDYNFATKPDLERMSFEFKTELQELRTELKTEIQNVRTELKTEIQDVRTDVQKLRTYMDTKFEKIDHRFDTLEYKLMIKLSGVIIVCMGAMMTLQKML